jgi:tetratricopeptide (TPR) repeat protein
MAKRSTPKSKPVAAATTPVQQTPSKPADWSRWVLPVILLFTAVLYWPALQNGFTNWDDDVYVTANENLTLKAQNLQVLSTKQVAGNFHPLTMGRWNEAITDFSQSLMLNPNQPQMYQYRSICYERTGRKAEAEADKVAAKH